MATIVIGGRQGELLSEGITEGQQRNACPLYERPGSRRIANRMIERSAKLDHTAPALWNCRGDFGGVGALVATRIDGSHDVVIGLACLDGRVCIGSGGDQRRI